MREDRHTLTIADAATFEQTRGQAYDDDPTPTPAELRRDALPERPTGEHPHGDDCLVCGLERALERMRRTA